MKDDKNKKQDKNNNNNDDDDDDDEDEEEEDETTTTSTRRVIEGGNQDGSRTINTQNNNINKKKKKNSKNNTRRKNEKSGEQEEEEEEERKKISGGGGCSSSNNDDDDDDDANETKTNDDDSVTTPTRNNNNDDDDNVVTKDTFHSLGITNESLLLSCHTIMEWKYATRIQSEVIPIALKGYDIIGLAETGSGKTGAFCLPIIQRLLDHNNNDCDPPSSWSSSSSSSSNTTCVLILTPTRELAFQIHKVLQGLGGSGGSSGIGLRSMCVVGGVDRTSQAIGLAKNPHVIVATPGRLLDHLRDTKGFNLRNVRYLVLDEADRMLSMDFEEEIHEILDQLPSNDEINETTPGSSHDDDDDDDDGQSDNDDNDDSNKKKKKIGNNNRRRTRRRTINKRQTFLFSATMTTQVQKLQRASLTNPVKISITAGGANNNDANNGSILRYQIPSTLQQYYIFIPAKYKDCYLTYIINEHAEQSILIFGATCNNVQRLTFMLRNLGFAAIALHGQMSQSKRLNSLHKFITKQRTILVCTDIASRGLDMPSVDLVLNYDLPNHGKEYIHRIGRTARAGRTGKTIAIVTQYDVEIYQRIEYMLQTKLPLYNALPNESTVLILLERVNDAQRLATRELKEQLAAAAAAGGGGRNGGRFKKRNQKSIFGRRSSSGGNDDNDGFESQLRHEIIKGYAGGSGGHGGSLHNQRGGRTRTSSSSSKQTAVGNKRKKYK